MKLAEMIINREGIGDILADGVRAASEKIGNGSEAFAVPAGGQELSMHDSRLDPGCALAYQCEPTPGRHTIASYQDTDLRSGKKLFPQVRQMAKQAKDKESKKVTLHTATSIYEQLINCTGLCLLGVDSLEYPLVDYLNAATGWKISADDYFKTGRRIQALRKAFNIREGLNPEDSKYLKLHIAIQSTESEKTVGEIIQANLADIISAHNYDEFVFAYNQPYFQHMSGLGLLPIHYVCGNVVPRLDHIARLDIAAVAVEESKKDFVIEIEEVVRRVDGRVAVLGNIDAVRFGPGATLDAMATEVKRQLCIGAGAKGFVVSTGSPFPLDTNPRLIDTMVATAHTS